MMLIDFLCSVIDRQQAAIGMACERTAEALERAAELCRWLAAVTRVSP